MHTDVIVADHLSVGYGTAIVVEDVSLRLAPGTLVALMGSNGSGKSTILKTLVGLIPPVHGSVSVLGGAPGRHPARTAYVPQHSATSETLPLRARDVVAMGRYAHLGLLSRFTRRDREVVDAAMSTMGVTAFAGKPLQSLSGGQCQRVHLAQAIAHEADVWFLDEPTAGLDAEGRDTVAACVAAARASGACVVVSTHDIDDAREADIVLLVAKEVIAQGSPREVLTDANLRRMYGFTGQH